MESVILLKTISNNTKCHLDSEGGDGCDLLTCDQAFSCRKAIDKVLNNILGDISTTFFHQYEAMKRFNSSEHFAMHAAQHRYLLKETRDVMRRFDTEGDRAAAIAGFNKLSAMLKKHINTTDLEMMAI